MTYAHAGFLAFMVAVEQRVRAALDFTKVRSDSFNQLQQELRSSGELRGMFSSVLEQCLRNKEQLYGEAYQLGSPDDYAADAALVYKNVCFLYSKTRVKAFMAVAQERVQSKRQSKRPDDALRTRLKNQSGGQGGGNSANKAVQLTMDHVERMGGPQPFLLWLSRGVQGEKRDTFLGLLRRSGLLCLGCVFGAQLPKSMPKAKLVEGVVLAARNAFEGDGAAAAISGAMQVLQPWLDARNDHERLSFRKNDVPVW